MSKNKANEQIISPPSSNPAPVPMITIDGVAYSQAELSDTTKQQLGNVRLVDQELAQLQRQRGIANVARATYVNAVSAALPTQPTAPKEGARSVVVDGVAHDWASLDERVQGLLAGIRAADQELAHLHTRTQLAQAARAAFALGVKQNLPKRAERSSGG